MPKSRFNPKSHSGNRNRNRHDPLSRRSNPSNSTSTSTTTATTTTTSDINQLIPVLSKLPLPDSNKPNTTSEADLLWALSSISVLLENRNSRKSLLNPSNKLSSRLINAFKSSLTPTPSSSNLQLRREASGALRNLCIEATRTNDKLLEVVVSEKGIQLVLDQLVWVSKQLGILEKDSNDKLSEEKEDLDSLLQANLINSQKPVDQLNRKEKRQLAKLNKALEKQQEKFSSSVKEDSKMEISEDKQSTSNGNEAVKSQQDQDQDSLDEKISLNFIAENCITILWCLIESTSTSGNDASMSSQTLINLNERSTILSFILSGFLKNGFQILQDQSIAIEGNENGNSSIIRRKEQLRESHLNLTIQSLNALNSISENNLIFSIGFLGLSENLLIELEEENESNSKKKGKKKSNKNKFVFVNPPDQKQGKENLNRLIETINFSIQNEGKVGGNSSVSEVEISHYSHIFAIISCSILRNLITSLPKKVSNDISVSSSSSNPSQISLIKFERNQVLPYLLKLIEKKSSHPDLDFPGSHLIQVIQEVEASTKNIKDQPTTTTNSDLKSTDPEKIVEGLNKSRVNGHSNVNGEVKKENDNGEEEEDDNNNNLDSESPLVIALKKNQSQLESKLLLMEVLAELVGTLPGGSDEDEEDEKEEEWKEEGEDDEILDGDEEMDQDRSGDEDQEMEMELESGLSKAESKDQDMMITTDESTNKSSTTTSTSIQNLSKSPLINLLANQNFLVRISTIIQSLSSNLDLSFPSVQTQSESKGLDLNLHYQSSKALRQILFRLTSIQSNFLMNFSNFFSPPPPSTPLEPESKQESIVEFLKQWSSNQVQFEIFVNIWKESFGLAAKLASLECLNNPTLIENQEETTGLSIKAKEFKDQSTSSRLLIENCISNLWSLSRLFQGSNLPLSLSSSTPNSNEIPLALISAYKTSIEDSMRVKCLSTLGCLARSEKVSTELNHQIGTFFIEILSNLKDANNNIPTTNKDSSFTTAESMVAVLDSLFDIYADENSTYDVEVFRKNDFKGKLRSVWGKVRAEARRIDRRRFPSLREKADEAAQNLMDFIKYRDGLGF